MKAVVAVLSLMTAAIAVSASAPPQLVYLSCDVPAGGDTPDTHYPATHFDFTLDEQNGTVSFYVKEAGAGNVEKAVFGPDSITWVKDMSFRQLTRTISRTNLTFVTSLTLLGKVDRREGHCSVVDTSKRKF